MLICNVRCVVMNKILHAFSFYYRKLFLYLLVWLHVQTGLAIGELLAWFLLIAYTIVRITFYKGYYDTKRFRIFYN